MSIEVLGSTIPYCIKESCTNPEQSIPAKVVLHIYKECLNILWNNLQHFGGY
jgi:hypothetical protein